MRRETIEKIDRMELIMEAITAISLFVVGGVGSIYFFIEFRDWLTFGLFVGLMILGINLLYHIMNSPVEEHYDKKNY